VTSILNKRQRNIVEQQQTFIRRNTDETKKRNNYLVDKFTTKKRPISLKENIATPTTKHISPKKKTPIVIIDDDDDDDFITAKKRPKIIYEPKVKLMVTKTDPIKECLESIIIQIENNDVICPICNQILSNLSTMDQRQQHVNRCLEEPKINNKPIKSKSKAKPSTPTLSSDSDAIPTKKLQKKPKLQTPTIPLKQIVRTYIESNSSLHARILCYEPIDFEEFHK
ncbi:unnamed protein product, partial [Rotaria socialis]